MKKIFNLFLFSVLFLMRPSFADSIVCPPFAACDNRICQMGPTPPFGYSLWGFMGKNSGSLRFVSAYTRPGSPRLICSYASKDRKTQADFASNDNLIADLKSPGNKWERGGYEEGNYMCKGENHSRLPGECPIIKN